MKACVIRFPASNCDLDTIHALRLFKVKADLVWHRDFKQASYDAIILPGGFSYGDYLRAGAIAAHSPALDGIREAAREGKPVLGICNGFQILVEAGLLPGALVANDSLSFICKWVTLRVNVNRTAFTGRMDEDSLLRMPIAHQEGRYFADKKMLKELYTNDQVVFQYVDEKGNVTPGANPNGSVDNIAGISNLDGNVLGLMPHPERASEKMLSPYDTGDGRLIFKSMIRSVEVANCQE